MAAAPRLVVLGRQGSGKGTQCSLLARRFGVPHLSTGDLLRAEIADGTKLGRTAAGYVDEGLLVPDELILDLVVETVGGGSGRGGYLLDGFPRTLSQAVGLFDVLGAGAADVAVEITVPTAVVLPRITARRVCQSCGRTYAVAAGGLELRTCRVCGGRVARREDDAEEAIARRLAAYEEESTPLLVWLDSQGLLVTIDGMGSPDLVHDRVTTAVAGRLGHTRALVDERSVARRSVSGLQ